MEKRSVKHLSHGGHVGWHPLISQGARDTLLHTPGATASVCTGQLWCSQFAER